MWVNTPDLMKVSGTGAARLDREGFSGVPPSLWFKQRGSTCTELRQQPLSGKRLTWVESGFQPDFREGDGMSLTSGKTSSITARRPLTLILSWSSGATWTTTHSGHQPLHSRSVLQWSSWDCSRVSWKKQASSYNRENSCSGTSTM